MANVTRDPESKSVHIDVTEDVAKALLDGGLREWLQKEYIPRAEYEALQERYAKLIEQHADPASIQPCEKCGHTAKLPESL